VYFHNPNLQNLVLLKIAEEDSYGLDFLLAPRPAIAMMGITS
tara:strand:+ start:683 stop:808 length:126 start_codon:yes stop_codon:yes gene_type:complete